MDYSNPEIPEGINTTREHPLNEFFVLLGGIVAIITVTISILSLAAEKLAVHIPFAMEQELVAGGEFPDDEKNIFIRNYLQQLVARLGPHMQLPEGMHISVHYEDSDIENAYATLGGHIYIYRGLMQLLPSENALAMVVAHEMAHIKHRHPIIAMGRGVVIGLFLASLVGASGDHFTGQVINNTGMITLLTFNRDQEREADETALQAVAGLYGHVAGAEELFKTLRDLENKHPLHPPQFLSTHPLNEDRIDAIDQLAEVNGWNITGETTPVPLDIMQSETVPD